MTQQMSGEDKAREVLADAYEADDMADVAAMLRAGGDGHMPTGTALAAMLTYGEQCREEGRLAALNEAIARAKAVADVGGSADLIATAIEALKDQK